MANPESFLLKVEATKNSRRTAKELYRKHKPSMDSLSKGAKLDFLFSIQEFDPTLMNAFAEIFGIHPRGQPIF